MKPWIAAFVSAIALSSLFATDELPKPEETDALEIEPPLLIQNRDRTGAPIIPTAPESVDLAKLESNLTRAKRTAEAYERLYRAGAVAKVEAEERALRVVRIQATLAAAQLQTAKSKAEQVTDTEPNESKIAQAEQAAKHAEEARQHAELEAALRNLQRQQKLLALGSGRKADVNRAEKKLSELQHPQN